MGPHSDPPRIERGLARYEPDYFAALGVPLTADAKQIKKSYLLAAKALHPDRFVGQPEAIEQANWLFAKLINPANEALSKDKDRAEYEAVIQLRIRRLVEKGEESLWPDTEAVRLLRRTKEWETAYVDAVKDLAGQQFSSLDQVLEKANELSELNLAYLLLKGGAANRLARRSSMPVPSPAMSSAKPAPSSSTSASTTPPAAQPSSGAPPARPKPLSFGETRYNQAMEMIERKQYKEAIQYLGIAINAEPNQARYYLQRGLTYLKMGNSGMAKADLQKTLRLEPTNTDAQKAMKQIEASAPQSSTGSETQPPQSSKAKADGDQGGGLLKRLFNRK